MVIRTVIKYRLGFCPGPACRGFEGVERGQNEPAGAAETGWAEVGRLLFIGGVQ